MINESLIQKHISTLGITREEAIELIQEDERIDRMTKTADINSDLTAEQIKNAKSARQADRTPTKYKKTEDGRKKKSNSDKKFLVENIQKVLTELPECDKITVLNEERELTFSFRGVNYKVVLSQPRG